jgi:hypothetical protein
MKIIQISTVLEGHYTGEHYERDDEAAIYGLGDDQKMYYWGRTKTTRVHLETPDEDGLDYKYEHEWGWKPYEP